jgi:AraC-like DNA-binding protein
MTQFPIIQIAEINKYIVTSDVYQNVFGVAELDACLLENKEEKTDYTSPLRLNGLFIFLILQGEAEISLDYVPYQLSANDFLIVMPSHVLQAGNNSSDFKAIIMMVDKVFAEEMNLQKRSPSMTNYLLVHNNPRMKLSPEETTVVKNGLYLLQDKIRQRTHAFHKELLQNAFVGFLLEMANILIGKQEMLVRPTLSRKEEILNQFLQLLFTHVKEHHAVTFFAENLFITPQYLSLILKELTGKSANKWIDEALMAEAKILLKMPNVTIQQVADQLNFSDQSTFGKFFKKHMGVSPMEYRKS